MNTAVSSRTLFPGQLALIVLASAIAIPAFAQQGQPQTDQTNAPAAAQSQQTPPSAPAVTPLNTDEREGFWGRVNPFARKKWVDKRVQPIKDQLNELDEVNAKNAKDIQDVDARAQAGIRQAQSTADTANQTATAAGAQAQQANGTAQAASGHVDQLNTTVSGLDQYKQVNEVEVPFRHGQPVLSEAARKQLDDLAANLSGRKGYILEVEGHAPAAGSTGIQNSARLAEAVKRYLVIDHDIPVYRLHAVALGNAHGQADADDKPVRTSTVHIRLMENSLAAQEEASPHGAASSTGAERP